MARINASIVYPEGKLFICRAEDGSSNWEVRDASIVATVKIPTPTGGERTVYQRAAGTPLATVASGKLARLKAIDLQVEAGTMTHEAGAARRLKVDPPKPVK